MQMQLIRLSTMTACLASALAGCDSPPAQSNHAPRVSSSLALTSDDRTLWVVNQDADSVSVIDTAARALRAEIPLAPAAPRVDPTTQRFDPAVQPRSLAIRPGDKKVYVAGQTSNQVHVIDAERRAVTKTIPVGAEPTAVVVTGDGKIVYVVNHKSATVSRIDAESDAVTGTLPVGQAPWGASLSEDGRWLYITQLLLEGGLVVVDTASFSVRNKVILADQTPDPRDKRVPNGVARGTYTAVPRPGNGELWLPHLLLAVETPQPALDFESTVFPTFSTVKPDGTGEGRRLLLKPPQVPNARGAFSDIVSGPRALAFTPDSKFALAAFAQSEDLIIFDAESGNEVELLRPLPATMLEGIVIDSAGAHAYVDGRNTHNIVVVSLDPKNTATPFAVDGAPIERLAADPMPETLRLGQRLFYTANSAAYPITRNFWVACSTCHLEGGTDAVTWLFEQGPRDTPSNAGGPINTGFLFRQAVRTSLLEYDETINIEQGGNFHRDSPGQKSLLDALATYVNRAIPFPQNPNRRPDGTLTDEQKRGKVLFDQDCARCHSGDYLTDSGAGNPTLDRNGPIVLYDIGVCVTRGAHPDMPAMDKVTGKARAACEFDTPTLRGIFATPPYLHDGSAATLGEVVDRLMFSSGLPAPARADLVAYLLAL